MLTHATETIIRRSVESATRIDSGQAKAAMAILLEEVDRLRATICRLQGEAAKIHAAILATIAILALAGCSSSPPPARETIRTVEVKVPVPVPVQPPAELLATVPPPAQDVFQVPGAPGAVACVDAAGRSALVEYVERLRNAHSAWLAWSAAQAD